MPHNEGDKKQLQRMTIVYIVLMVAGLFVIGGFVKIQLFERKMWQDIAEKHEAEEIRDEARRGNIYSSDGKIMATTIPICNLYVDLGSHTKYDKKGRVVKDSVGNPVKEKILSDSLYNETIDTVCSLLGELGRLGRDAQYYRNRFDTERAKNKPSRCFLIERNIPYTTWDKIVRLEGWGRFVVKLMGDGSSVIRQSREHIYGNLAENCIGFGYNDHKMSTGLEGFYNSVLAGQDGLYECRRLTRGVWIPVTAVDGEGQSVSDTLARDKQKRERVDGADIVATIDTRYQDIAETALRQALHRSGGTSRSTGCAILMEASTGYVLACSNLAWDSVYNEYREMPDKNIACSDLYNPGSTIKTVLLTAMMNDSTMTIDTSMRIRACVKNFTGLKDGEIKDDHYLYKDAERKIRKDTITLKEAITISSNVAMCELGWQNYYNRRGDLMKLMERVFPYDVLHLDLKTGEYKPIVNDITLSQRDFLGLCFGYSQSISAMQLITFYNALANGGKMMKPLFCRAIIRNGEHQEMKPVVMRESICSKKTLKTLNDLLVNVVEHGTGDNIKDNSYGIAGKTGTSVYLNSPGIFNASFAGYFPAENPKYTCLVVVKHVPAYGRSAAAPVFKKISDCVVALDNTLENGKIEVGSQTGEKLMQVVSTKKVAGGEEGVVPDCRNMTIREAIAALETRGLRASFTGSGRVVKQEIQHGTKLKKGSRVQLTLKNN